MPKTYSEKQLIETVLTSYSWREVGAKLGKISRGRYARKIADRLDLDYSHFWGHRTPKRNQPGNTTRIVDPTTRRIVSTTPEICIYCGLTFTEFYSYMGHMGMCKLRPNASEIDTRKTEKLTLASTGKVHSSEARRKMSIARSKHAEEVGGGCFPQVKWYREKNLDDEEFILRGMLEVKIAQKLNSENRLWIRKIYLDYIDQEGNIRIYTPDFYLPFENLYIEAKGYYSPSDQYKIQAAVDYNNIACLSIVFKVW